MANLTLREFAEEIERQAETIRTAEAGVEAALPVQQPLERMSLFPFLSW